MAVAKGNASIQANGGAKQRHTAVLNLSTDFTKEIYPQLIHYFRQKRAPFFTGIGTEVLGNKGFLPYINTLTKYYLGEDPILQTPPTRILVPKQLESPYSTRNVLKRANGIQGNEVHILSRMKQRKRRNVFRRLNKDFRVKNLPIWVEQHYVPASFIRDARTGRKMEVNLRPFSYLLGGAVFSSPLPWGRIGTNAAQPLVNISQGAQELVVFDEALCRRM